MAREFSVADAFDATTPIGTVDVGGIEHSVPPMTFGKFLKLLGVDFSRLQRIFAMSAEALEHDDVEYVCEIIRILVSEEAAKDFARCPSAMPVIELYNRFGHGHDWEFIAKHLAVRADGAVASSPIEDTIASLAMAFHVPIDSVLSMRIDGFYMMASAADRIARRSSDAQSGGEPMSSFAGSDMRPARMTDEEIGRARAAFDRAVASSRIV